ncbi:hypothetical protein NNJEOMEG_02801 [Fundidesulfovibrio magnetotacticus]|uniref:Aminoglycoside phosphotransferase domain-containing protein n=1 Tax=Fundidesulfovibrio magnetotacticus TaxID=2730080 RepID=A0A6V8LR40_9BACT|nr:phosphotransferase [Fundidesulfovibrio magnetotacticus]GFK94953.1 hypothetical protein NNJEOMEG_02801 [Fundidesulfovibrio magnetotacticus]
MSSDAEALWERLAGGPVLARRLSSNGRNSRVYRLELPGGGLLAGKRYPQNPADPRDRLGAELAGLTLCRRAGLRVPEPVAFSREEGALLMEFVRGEPVGDPGESGVDEAVAFLAALRALSAQLPGQAEVALECGRDLSPGPLSGGQSPGHRVFLAPASEACFTGQALAANLEVRLQRLEAARGEEPEYAALTELVSALRARFARALRESPAGFGPTWETPLPEAQRTLSPSDFGFHNALRLSGGGLCFLDLEYFGRDDPAKTLCDFVLHPGMALPDHLAGRFLAGAGRALLEAGGAGRSVAAFPFYALKWCAIVLNEFVAADRARRDFAGRDTRRETLRRQLALATRILEDLDERHAWFGSRLA